MFTSSITRIELTEKVEEEGLYNNNKQESHLNLILK